MKQYKMFFRIKRLKNFVFYFMFLNLFLNNVLFCLKLHQNLLQNCKIIFQKNFIKFNNVLLSSHLLCLKMYNKLMDCLTLIQQYIKITYLYSQSKLPQLFFDFVIKILLESFMFVETRTQFLFTTLTKKFIIIIINSLKQYF